MKSNCTRWKGGGCDNTDRGIWLSTYHQFVDSKPPGCECGAGSHAIIPWLPALIGSQPCPCRRNQKRRQRMGKGDHSGNRRRGLVII